LLPCSSCWPFQTSSTPAGDPSKKEGQFAFPGTSGITDETYGMVLRDLVLGAATVGFKDIILIGDHGGGQEVLKQTAATLDGRLNASGATSFPST
jgi:creatinine amidohydrolase/Fe(II)-dependent formamide hydrolase-like protein